jgi:hypothetical protein
MFCPQCGKKNPDVASFCFNCGTTLSIPVPAVVATDVVPSAAIDNIAYAPQRTTETAEGKQCPVCGLFNPGTAERCDCGHDFSRAWAADHESPLFPVATHKFIVMSICTFGLYELYWCYQNWLRLETPEERIRPFWRAVFAPIWSFALFGRIKNRVNDDGIPVEWNAKGLAAVYVALNLLWRLPDPWWLLTYLSVVPMIPVQQATQQLNARTALGDTRNVSYTTPNVITIVVGGTLFVLAVVGAVSKVIR